MSLPQRNFSWPKYKVKTLGIEHSDFKESSCLTTCRFKFCHLYVQTKIMKEVNKLFYMFLSNEKGDKTKRNTIINDCPYGGLKMIDIFSFNKSLKAKWIRKYLDEENQGKWNLFFDLALDRYGGKITITSNLNEKDTAKTLKVKNPFLNEVLAIWSEINFKEQILSEKQFLNQVYDTTHSLESTTVLYSIRIGIRKGLQWLKT